MFDRVQAQGIDHISLSGEYIAEQLRQSSVDQPYNLKIGPVSVRAESGITTSYNDNINLTKVDPIADFIITPTATLHGRWAVSELNTLTFNIGLGYQMYLSHSQDNTILLAPDTNAQFNFFVGNVMITLHDGFSYQQDPTQIGQLSNTTRLQRFTNDAGVAARWDLSSFVLSLEYDHVNFWVTDSIYDYLTNESDTISPKITYQIDKAISAGLVMSFTDTRYDKSFQNDNRNLSVGPFVSAMINEDLSVQGQLGGYFTEYDQGGGNGDDENIGSYYGSFGINHRITQYIRQSLTAGREYIPGLTSNFTERVYANYTATWKATDNIELGGNLLWENLKDSSGTLHETSDRYGLGFSVTDGLNERTRLTLNYQYLVKDSDPEILGYTQNLISAGLNYQF